MRLSRLDTRWKGFLFWGSLTLVAGAPRVIAAFRFPNPDGDPYSYFEAMERMRAALAGGYFSVKDLFGFWLPLYQFISALLSLVVDHPIYISKLVSAICGTGVCLLVYQISQRVTGNRVISLIGFGLVVVNPLHVLFSGFTGPDVPHAFLVLLTLALVLRRQWVLASVIVFLAGLMRVESWMLIAIIPLLQFLIERRVSIIAIAIMLLAPAFWLYICWAATGHALAYFSIRAQYVREILAAYPELTRLSRDRISLNLERMTTSANHAILIGGLIGAWICAKRSWWFSKRPMDERIWAAVSLGAFYFAYLLFLVLSFVTNNQPDLWERYGLIIFVLGIPFLAWTWQAVAESYPRLKVWAAAAIAFAFVYQLDCQGPYVTGFREQSVPTQIVANHLRDLHEVKPASRVFSDDPNVPVLANIPANLAVSPDQNFANDEALLSVLNSQGIEYVVVDGLRNPTAAECFPELGKGIGNDLFELVFPITPKDWHGAVWLYRYHRRGELTTDEHR
jgi:hypothetical protein